MGIKMAKTLVAFCILFVRCSTALSEGPYAPAPGQQNAPSRIVSLKPNITEILFALGAGGKVVGVTTWCDRPAAAKNITRVADYINIDTERIMALRPDIVIGSEENSVRSQFEVLKNAGIRTLTVPFRSFDDLYSSIQKIAAAVGEEERGRKLVKNIKDAVARPAAGGIRHGPGRPKSAGSEGRNRRTVLILVGHRPLVAAGPVTFYGEMLEKLGANNMVDTKRTPYPVINTEFILARSPDVIIDMAMGSEAGSELPESLRGRVKQFNLEDMRAGPGIVEAMKRLDEAINP